MRNSWAAKAKLAKEAAEASSASQKISTEALLERVSASIETLKSATQPLDGGEKKTPSSQQDSDLPSASQSKESSSPPAASGLPSLSQAKAKETPAQIRLDDPKLRDV